VPLDPPVYLRDVIHDFSSDAAAGKASGAPGLDRAGRDAEVLGQGLLAEEAAWLELGCDLVVHEVMQDVDEALAEDGGGRRADHDLPRY
jgi:hypothetical protein